jgi:hypothetical protein
MAALLTALPARFFFACGFARRALRVLASGDERDLIFAIQNTPKAILTRHGTGSHASPPMHLPAK